MRGRWRALLRLLAVQGTWNYERMLGVGMGYAAEPLLDDLRAVDPTRHAEAVVRSVEFFNSQPYLAGVALGATVRAEYDGIPGPQIARLRTALCSPLGALGDQVFWAGLLPALLAAALIGITFGATWAVGAFVAVYAAVRLWATAWGLATGLRAGMQVGSAIQASWLPRAVKPVGAAAGFLVGAAVPLAADWLLAPWSRGAATGALVVAAVGVALSQWWGSTFTAVRYGLITLGLAFLWTWVAA
ncbi:MAG TPA: PTS system mannose/fructose/sorbose family transporter subunit IID [Gemmatimonadales bacterium]|nr:PTS system mannose/fructose/sorbose family transporter subunit IID [Gemmatimonadales bacterium]